MRPLLYIAAAAGVLYALTAKKESPVAQLNPRGAPPEGGTRFVRMVDIPPAISAEPGDVWLAELDVPFFARALVTEKKLKEGLAEKGLLGLRVTRERPEWWPVLSNADWYILATVTGAKAELEVPSAIQRLWTVRA